MSNPRAKTLQQRFGFQDPDLKTSLHDEIMIWLDNNVSTIMKDLGWLNLIVTRDDGVRKDLDYARENKCPENLIEDALKFEPSEFELVWEYPVKSEKYIVGFVDLRVRYKRAFIEHYEEATNREWEWRWRSGIYEKCVNFEVKTGIRSLGELIRHIRMYQVYMPYEPLL